MPKSQLQPTRSGSPPSTPLRVEMDTLIQGVSQQPEHLRLQGQSTEQLNGWSSTVEGLTKRNGARFQAKVFDSALENFYLEMFQISQGEIYSVLLSPATDATELRILRNGTAVIPKVHGTGLTVDVGTGVVTADQTSYLHAEPTIDGMARLFDSYVLINSGPIGLLMNRTVATAMKSTTSPARTNEGLILIQAVAYQVTYLTWSWRTTVVVPAVTTPAATDDNNQISTSSIAKSLTDNINALAGWKAVQSDYVVIVTREDDAEFRMTLDDTRSNTLGRAFTDQVTTIGELPQRASNGYKVNVSSDPSTNLDDRWLEFTTFDGSDIGEVDGARRWHRQRLSAR